MYLHQAIPKLSECVGIRFKDLFSELPDELLVNKGNVGQLLQIRIGLPLDSSLTDFKDGELKTNKSDSRGVSRETMFITQISKLIDSLVCDKPMSFESSNLFQKIRRILFLPVCKDSASPEDWFFVSLIDVNLDENSYLYSELKEDYFKICRDLKEHIQNSDDGYIHTSSGEFIQIRSKDSKPYHPIYSKTYGRYVSNKNHAFYFKKNFMSFARQYGNVINSI